MERLSGVGSGPFEVDAEVGPPAVQGPLVGSKGDEPSDGDEFLSGVLDPSETDAEDVGDPGGFDPSARDIVRL